MSVGLEGALNLLPEDVRQALYDAPALIRSAAIARAVILGEQDRVPDTAVRLQQSPLAPTLRKAAMVAYMLRNAHVARDVILGDTGEGSAHRATRAILAEAEPGSLMHRIAMHALLWSNPRMAASVIEGTPHNLTQRETEAFRRIVGTIEESDRSMLSASAQRALLWARWDVARAVAAGAQPRHVAYPAATARLVEAANEDAGLRRSAMRALMWLRFAVARDVQRGAPSQSLSPSEQVAVRRILAEAEQAPWLLLEAGPASEPRAAQMVSNFLPAWYHALKRIQLSAQEAADALRDLTARPDPDCETTP
jgi:hypothetical protein